MKGENTRFRYGSFQMESKNDHHSASGLSRVHPVTCSTLRYTDRVDGATAARHATAHALTGA